MVARIICVCSTWRKGRVKSRIDAATPEDPLDYSAGCLHELPPSAQPVGADTQRKVLLLHEARLAPGSSRCALDARPALRKALRERELPVRVVVTSQDEGDDVLAGVVLGCTQRLTVRDVVQRLDKEIPGGGGGGSWQLFEEGAPAAEPLLQSHRLLRDALRLPSASAREVVLRATRESSSSSRVMTYSSSASMMMMGERTESLVKRLRAAEALAADQSGAPAGEKAAARRGAEKIRRRLLTEETTTPSASAAASS